MTQPYMKFFLRKSDEPRQINVDRSVYDLLTSFEPLIYPRDDESYLNWRKFNIDEYDRQLAHFNCGGLYVDKIGIDPDNEHEIILSTEARPDFARWV